jgi:molybdenum cofactor cytidylyltransferase
MPAVGLILLAAGESRRLGSPKQLLPYRRRTLLRHATEVALGSTCRPVVVVLGAQPDRMREELAGVDVVTIVNDGWEQGVGTSIAAGIRALDPDASIEAAVIMLCDQPEASSDLIDTLVATYRRDGRPIAASAYSGGGGVPALFDRTLFPELLTLRESGAKGIIAADPERVSLVPFPGGEHDVDTPDHAARLSRHDS